MRRLRPFEKRLMKALSIHLLPKLDANREALSEVLANDLIGGDGPRRFSAEYTWLEFGLWRVYGAHREVEKSIATLADLGIYLRACPFPESEIPASRYLQFHAEAFVGEIYILRERMETLEKLGKRQAKKQRSTHVTQEQFDALLVHIRESLEPVVDIRRRHTHEQRLNDPVIERLDTIALLGALPGTDLSSLARREAARATRQAFVQLRRRVMEQTRIAMALRKSIESHLLRALFFDGSPYLRTEA